MRKPALGFLGVGRIGRHRMQAIVDHGLGQVVAVADPSPAGREHARAIAPRAYLLERIGQLLELSLDGIVIATPSALHAEHCLAALARGRAVFCQTPLGRNAPETQLVVDAARHADRLLAVDLSYRYTEAMRRVRDVVQRGDLGRVYAIDLVFHDASAPAAPWSYDKLAAGGGCMIDLGAHLVDLALWLLDFPRVHGVESRLFAGGEAIAPSGRQVEDFAAVHVHLEGGAVVRLACSWRASAGRDAVIEASIHGTRGGAAMKNVNGSADDFVAERYEGTRTEQLTSPPDAWHGRAAVDWVERLARGAKFDDDADRLVDVARVLDAIYERGGAAALRGVA